MKKPIKPQINHLSATSQDYDAYYEDIQVYRKKMRKYNVKKYREEKVY